MDGYIFVQFWVLLGNEFDLITRTLESIYGELTMSVKVKWHGRLPILVTIYQGTLSVADHKAMRNRQRALLDEGPDRVVLLADCRQFSGFPDADCLDPEDYLVAFPTILCTVVVLDAALYDRLARAILPANGPSCQIFLFKSLDAALAQAEVRLRGAGR
jgi:hypothetical protein